MLTPPSECRWTRTRKSCFAQIVTNDLPRPPAIAGDVFLFSRLSLFVYDVCLLEVVMPPETRACSSLLTFRKETKSHLFRQSYGWRGAVRSDRQQTSALSCATVLDVDFVNCPATVWLQHCNPTVVVAVVIVVVVVVVVDQVSRSGAWYVVSCTTRSCCIQNDRVAVRGASEWGNHRTSAEGVVVRLRGRVQFPWYTTLRQANIEPMPSLSDVRRLVTEYTILPLGIYHTFVVLHSSLFTEKKWKLYSYNKACKRQT